MTSRSWTRREWMAAVGALSASTWTLAPRSARGSGAIDGLDDWLRAPRAQRPPLADQPFARVPLSKAEADAGLESLWKDHVSTVRQERQGELESGVLKIGDKEMPIFFKTFGDPPADGHSLWISMHGGGNAPPRVNDRQWENQKRLYTLDEGIYVAPRAPTNTWDLWHQSHIDALFDRLIEDMVVFQGVDPDRVYLNGYSAGGDGVYQLAPRMADRFAAAAMMAGHPNETRPDGLRNLPFALQVGGNDAAYDRNKVAREWGGELDHLSAADPGGYTHLVKIHEGKGHWMGGEDKLAFPWMAGFRRRATPDRVVWLQDDVTHDRFYWLAVPPGQAKARTKVVARREGRSVLIEQAEGVERLLIRWNDRMSDLDQPVSVKWRGETLHEGIAPRTLANLAATLDSRGDKALTFSAEVAVSLT
ncbi:MAG: alpha/beta hydrolase [Isosphaeraceae bacterium]